MEPSQAEAQASLSMIEQTQIRMRRAMAASYGSGLLILWGSIWMVGFVALHCSRPVGGIIFGGLDLIGVIVSILITRQWPERTVHQGKVSQAQGRSMILLGVSLLVFGGIWALLLKPDNSIQICAYVCTLCMFGYVIIGLWFDAPLMVGLGLVVALMVLLGYQWFTSYFYLWMAPMGGGVLLGTGFYIRRWR